LVDDDERPVALDLLYWVATAYREWDWDHPDHKLTPPDLVEASMDKKYHICASLRVYCAE